MGQHAVVAKTAAPATEPVKQRTSAREADSTEEIFHSRIGYSLAAVPTFAAGSPADNPNAWQRNAAYHSGRAVKPVGPRINLQAKLMVGAVNDPLEMEADRVADQVMRMPEPHTAAHSDHAKSSRSANHSDQSAHAGGSLHRKCDCGGSCDECKKHEDDQHVKVQMKANGAGSAYGMEAPPIVHEVLRSSGKPLDSATRAFMEPRFGHDFSNVRIHTDAKAAESAKAVGARAYTVGSNVVFGAGQYGPRSTVGQSLLGHELAHVVQQEWNRCGSLQKSSESTSEASPKSVGTTASQSEAETDALVEKIQISTNGLVMIETATKPYIYELESWHLDEGTYTATVSVAGKTVNLNFGPKGSKFHFTFKINRRQENPATLLKNQKTVTVEVVPDLEVPLDTEGTDCLLPMDDLTLIESAHFTPVSLFKPINKSVEWSFGKIPLGWLGWISANASAGISASGLLSGGYGPGVLKHICLFQKVDRDKFKGRATFGMAAAISPSFAAAGEVRISADYVGLASLASVAGKLDAKAKGILKGSVTSNIEIIYDRAKKAWSLVSDSLLTGAAGMKINLTASAAITLLYKTVWSEEWKLLDKDFQVGWEGGLRIGTDAKPRFEFGSVGVLSSSKEFSAVTVPNLKEASAPDPLGSAKIDAESVFKNALGQGAGKQHVPLGLTPNDPLPIIWYKPLEIYPRILQIPRATSPAELNRDDGPTLVLFKYGRGSDSTKIGVSRGNWPKGPTAPGKGGKPFQYSSNDPGDTTKDQLVDLFKKKLLAPGETLRTQGFDLDHVMDKQFGGQDVPENLWPADYQENQLAGTLHQHDIANYKDTFAGMDPKDGGGALEGRWFQIVEFKRASSKT